MTQPFSVSFNVHWQAAIDQAQSRGVLLPEAYYALPDALKGQAQTISGMTRLDQIQAVIDKVNDHIATGGTLASFQKQAAAQHFGLNKNHLDLVFRNATQNAYQAGHWRNFEANKTSRGYLMYSAINDSRTRPAHRALSGMIRPVDDAFWATHSPPCGHRCFLPDTKVGGRFEIGLKAFYSGVAVEIITSNGNRLAVTANHPILTRQGMIRADEVQQGFDLVTDCRDVDAIAAFRDINNEQLPSRADEVFDALSLEAFGLAQATSFDLYGDAAFIKGDVQVVGRKGALMHGFKPAPFKFVNKRIFNWANHFSGTFANDCINKSPLLNAMSGTLARLLRRCGDYLQYAHSFKHCAFSNPIRTRHSVAAVAQRCAFNNGVIHTNQYPRLFSSLPCRAALAFYRCAVSLKCRPFNLFGITSPSDRDARIKQKDAQRCASNSVLLCRRFFAHAALIISNRFNWNRLASLNTRQGKEFSTPPHLSINPLKTSIDGSVAATELLRNLINGQAAQVKFTQVLSIRQFHYSGHVYDFQTDNGLIIAEGIYTSNCRCTLISLTEAQARDRSPVGAGLNKSIEGLSADKGWGYKPTQQGEKLKALESEKLGKARPEVVKAYNVRMQKPIQIATTDEIRGFLESSAKNPLDIATLPADIAIRLGAKSDTVLLSRYTADKQRKHPEVMPESYAELQSLLDNGERIYDKANHVIVVALKSTPWLAVLKVTNDFEWVFLQSLRRTDESNLKSLRKRIGGDD